MKLKVHSTIKLAGTKEGLISLASIKEPYGEGSAEVISIATSLKEGKIDWKVHIPKENLAELIVALEAIKSE